MKFTNSSKNSLALIAAVAALLSLCLTQSVLAGSLAAWGRNEYGQCNMPAGSDFVAVAAAKYHSVALKADSSLAAWGFDRFGNCSNIPGGTYQIDNVWYSNSSDFAAIAASWYHGLVLKADGSLAAWGDNGYGQCDVPAGTDYIDIATGGTYSLAIKADGSLAAWGDNRYGQCDVPAGTDYIDITCGYVHHSLALKADGSLAAWGWNDYGQCDVPTGDYTAIAAGDDYSLALKADGSLTAWGRNDYGQCDVPAGSDFVAIVSSKNYHCLAIKADGSLVGWGRNDYGQCNVPAGYFVAISCGKWHSLAIVGEPVIEALIDIDPDTLNRKSHGKWITVYITLPEGFDVGTIDTSSIAITSLIGDTCDSEYTQEADPSFVPQVGDRDEDGIADLTVKFDRQVLLANLCLDDVSITIEGKLTTETGELFSGSDSIRIIDRGK